MPGLTTYPNSNRVVSAQVGYSILQAGVQGYLNSTTISNATSVDDLIDSVNAAVVSPGSESPAQRLSITRALREGGNLGDLGASRVQGATSVQTLAELTWVDADSAYSNGHLGPSFFG